MHFFLSKFKWIMVISGILTCTMFLGLISPQSLLKSNFGEVMQDNTYGEIVVRNWGALIGLMGIMLIYGAFNKSVRRFVLVMAGTSKIIFICLVLLYGKQYMSLGAGAAVIADSIMVALYIVYLLFSGPRKTVTH